MNPQVMQMLMQVFSSNNPEEAVKGMLKQMNNPMANSILQMVNEGKQDQIYNYAQQYANNNGINFEDKFNSFKQMLSMLGFMK